MNRKTIIERDTLVFLYAYLRQIDLSLDRCRWTSWAELQHYYHDKINPARVINYLLKYAHLNLDTIEWLCSYDEETSWLRRLGCFLFRTVNGPASLAHSEILCCCKLLSIFDEYLKSDFQSYNLEVEKLRIDIAKFYSNVLECKLRRKDSDKAMRIEHYFQNSILKTTPMEEFSRGIYL